MPTARRLSDGSLRAELWSRDRLAFGSLAYGFGQHYEATVTDDSFGSDAARLTGTIAYHYLSPIADITPGIAAGILDVANQTTDGRRAYVSVTMNRSLPGITRFGYCQLTGGAEFGRHGSPTGGIRLSIAPNVQLAGVYDGFRFSSGIELTSTSGAYGGLTLRGARTYVVLGIRR